MTSDRGNSGGAEMQLSNTPVTPKTPGLNPNAIEFHSKTPASPPAGDNAKVAVTPTETAPAALQWQELGSSVVTPESDNGDVTAYSEMNGDITKAHPAVIFPPTPESPHQRAPLPTDYTTVNGTMPAEVLFPSTEGSDTPESLSEGSIPEDQLRGMLKTQLEYYFSRENLANDSYLVSQMDADQYVAISTVAGFNQVKRLTTNIELVIEILRESSNVQVDEKGEKVRPLHKRCVVILREIPDTTPLEEVEKLFSGVNCPKFVSCEFAHNNSWYVTFEGDEDAQRAYQYLREDVRNFLGKPIMARIKAKPLLRSTFVPKNGFKQPQQFDPNGLYAGQQQQQVQQQAQQQAQTQQRYPTYTQVPSSSQYAIGQQSFPFFPPNTVTMHTWPANPMPFFDPGTKKPWPSSDVTVDLGCDRPQLRASAGDRHSGRRKPDLPYQAFAANGYTPTATFKLSNSSNQHRFQNVRSNRNQSSKPHSRGNQGNQDRLESRSSHDRHAPVSTARSSPRTESSHVTSLRGGRNSTTAGASSGSSEASPSQSHSHSQSPSSQSSGGGGPGPHAAGHGATTNTTTPTTTSDPLTTLPSASVKSQQQTEAPPGKDQTSGGPRRTGYRSRRRRDDDSSKGSRTSGLQVSTKEARVSGETPKFELEATSFPPLPGSTNNTTSGDVFENKMSDVVKGTAKAVTREVKGQTSAPPATLTTTMPTPTAPPTPPTAALPCQQDKEQPAAAAATPAPAVKETPKEAAKEATTPVATASQATPPTAATPAISALTVNIVKEKPMSPTVNGVCSLPTPPQSPQRLTKVASLDSSLQSTATTKTEPRSTAASGALSQSTNTLLKQDDGNTPVKLSYAQMVQRTKEREAAERLKDSDGTPGACGATKEATQTLAPLGSGSSALTTASSSPRPQALREQSQTSQPSPTRAEQLPLRKDREEPREQRVIGRRAKENRDRRSDRERFPERDRERDRFRERRREREVDGRVASK